LDVTRAHFCEIKAASFLSRCHGGHTLRKKSKKTPGNRIRSSVNKEMAKPRMTRSARIAELNLDPARVPEPPSLSMPGSVEKIISTPCPAQPEKAQIAVDGTDPQYRDLRIENALIDEHGDDVKLKKGAHVEIKVTTDPET
jgi:hypothetical protein